MILQIFTAQTEENVKAPRLLIYSSEDLMELSDVFIKVLTFS